MSTGRTFSHWTLAAERFCGRILRYGKRIAVRRKVDAEVLTACSLVGVAVFPVVGNALALLLEIPRRAGQAIVVFGFASLATYGWCRLYDYRTLIRGVLGRWLICAFSISIGLVAVLAIPAIVTGSRPTLYAAYVVLVTPLWVSLALLNLVGVKACPESSGQLTISHSFNRFVCTLLAGLALISYFRGPDEGQVSMAFGGSTTLAGMGAAMLGGVALARLKGWYRPVGLLLAMYLAFVATSRFGLLLFALLIPIIFFSRSIRFKSMSDPERKVFHNVALLVFLAIMVVLPARFSMFYPYFSSRPGGAGARAIYPNLVLTEWEAIQLRYYRFLRLLKTKYVGIDSPPAAVRALEESGSIDSRWNLILDSVKAVAAKPWGYWPQSFNEVTQIYCGRPPTCAYPHNLLLEIGFHFGWIPLGIVAIGVLVWGIRVLGTLTYSALPVGVAAVAFLGHLGYAQVSGNLLDHLLAMGLGVIWMAVHAGLRKQPTWRSWRSSRMGGDVN